MPQKKKAKPVKARVTKVEKLEAEKHIVAVEYEVHGPEEALPKFDAVPIEVTKEAVPETPEHHWYDFLTNW